jgi:fatty acid/phospholipid biosynthesis enzyme
MAEALLDIATITAPAAAVSIDGERYALLSVAALPLASIQRIQRDGPRLGELLKIEEKTPNQTTETSQLLRSVCELVLEAPADVHARLSDVHRVAIIHSFMQLQSTPVNRPRTGVLSTGAKSSRGSNGSTVARRKRG